MTFANLFQQLRGACCFSSLRKAWNFKRSFRSISSRFQFVARFYKVRESGRVRGQGLGLLGELGLVQEIGDGCGYDRVPILAIRHNRDAVVYRFSSLPCAGVGRWRRGVLFSFRMISDIR